MPAAQREEVEGPEEIGTGTGIGTTADVETRAGDNGSFNRRGVIGSTILFFTILFNFFSIFFFLPGTLPFVFVRW